MSEETKAKILHVDDDEANRYAVRRILERSNFEVIDAASGWEGLEKVQQQEFDLIILDIKLPDINGFEVCRRIKADSKTKSIPILQTSASFVTSTHKVEGLESGADGYLAQPIEGAVLVATVKSLLRIREAEKAAIKAQRSRDELLAIVSHDLRNPLSTIMLLTKLLQKQIIGSKLSEEEIIEKLVKVQTSGLRMNKLIQDLLDVSTMDEGKFSITKSNFDVEQLISEVIESFEESSADALIQVKTELPNEKIILNADKERLFQVFANLISNAIKFTPPHGEIRIKVTTTDYHVIFMVSDTGKGISKESLENIFNRYWQSPEEKNSHKGYGLGLSIVKGIIEAHSGSIRAESEQDKGTSIFFRIPK